MTEIDLNELDAFLNHILRRVDTNWDEVNGSIFIYNGDT